MPYTQKILSIAQVTHDVKCIRFKKPEGFEYVPGQATDVSVNKPGWENEKRPFTFTSLNEDPYLEFTIKGYPEHKGVTEQVHHLQVGDELIIDDPWGTISYKGVGYFIAGGAGITPFMAILRQLHKEGKLAGNKLFFSNKTDADIIYQHELEQMLGDDAVFVITDDANTTHVHGFINEQFLKKQVDDFSKHFYVCGPDHMIKAISDILEKNGAKPDAVVFEK